MKKELYFPDHFFNKNRENLIKKLPVNSVTFILSNISTTRSNDTCYKFRQDSNFFYFTGLSNLKRAVLAIVKKEDGAREIIFRETIDQNLEKWLGKNISEKEIVDISKIKDIRTINDLKDFYETTFKIDRIESVYLYNEPFSGKIVPTYTQAFAHNIKTHYTFIKITAVNDIIINLRLKKQPIEIKMIKRAAEITKIAFDKIFENIRPSIHEKEIESILIGEYVKNGAYDDAFQPIVASGANATTLHYEDNSSKSKKDDLILVDSGAEYNFYAADVTRTIPVKGRYSNEQKKFYDIVLNAQKETIKAIKIGISLNELNEVCSESLFQGLKKIRFIRTKEELKKYYYHGVSHFLGIDVHDIGNKNIKLEKNMVITVEPGLYIEEKGIGIRLENDIWVKEDGYENLTRDIAIEIKDIENIIKKINKVYDKIKK